MTRRRPALKLAIYLDRVARRLKRGVVGDVRIIAALMERAAAALRKVS